MNGTRLVDLSLTIAEDHPGWWPSHVAFQRKVWNWYETKPDPQPGAEKLSRSGPYFTEWLLIDEHTGTHFDAPTHFVPHDPSSPNPSLFGDQVDPRIFCGPCDVIEISADCCSHEGGMSPEITPAMILDWERRNGRIAAGDIVLFKTRWDRYYVPGQEGGKYVTDVLVTKNEPGWPAPDVPAIEVLLERGVRCAGTDAPSMGSAHNGAPVHVRALSQGMVFIEALTNLDALPSRGAQFVFLPLKVKKSSGGPGRAVAWL